MNYMYPQQPQMVRPTYPNTAPYVNRIRPVSSLEEVKGSAIDFDGSVFYFPDAANQTIYTKQINLDGTALIKMYVMQDIPATPRPDQLAATYVSKDEFQQTVSLLLGEIEKMKGVKENDESNDTTTSTTEYRF